LNFIDPTFSESVHALWEGTSSGALGDDRAVMGIYGAVMGIYGAVMGICVGVMGICVGVMGSASANDDAGAATGCANTGDSACAVRANATWHDARHRHCVWAATLTGDDTGSDRGACC